MNWRMWFTLAVVVLAMLGVHLTPEWLVLGAVCVSAFGVCGIADEVRKNEQVRAWWFRHVRERNNRRNK